MKKTPAKATYSLSELSRIIGVSPQALTKWRRLAGFPEATDGEKREALPVVLWWLEQRASSKIQRDVHSRLAAAIGIAEDGTSAADQMSESDRLDLMLKAHKVAKAVGDSVSFADIRAIVAELATEIRQACAGVNAATGRDVLPLFDEAFDRFEQSLNATAIQAGDDAQ